MSTTLKRILIGAVVVAAMVFGIRRYQLVQTKKASPEETISFYFMNADSLNVEITYCRPYKKGRVIFGGLVPYNKVWRTGANEATLITVSKDIRFGDKPIRAGTYTLWTLPGPDAWTVYLNSKMYSWGVDMDGNAQRDPAFDVAAVSVPVKAAANAPVEQFRINMEEDSTALALTLTWDDVMVAVPIVR